MPRHQSKFGVNRPLVLIVEDEGEIADAIQKALDIGGFESHWAPNRVSGLAAARTMKPNVVLLDLMLPDGNGIRLIRDLRAEGISTPIIILSARSAVADRVAGLNAGADDYVSKPFSMDELLARVRVRLKASETAFGLLQCGDLVVDRMSRQATRGGRRIFLSNTEFSLLEQLALNKGRLVRKSALLERVWDDSQRDPNLVEVYMSYLRSKMERGGAARLVHTVRGKGYILDETDQRWLA